MKRSTAAVTAFLGLLSLAPTPGDIGGCGQAVEPLSAPNFFVSRQAVECRRCGECGYGSLCDSTCDGEPPLQFPDGCEPLVHDGTVCLRALEQASCFDVGGLFEAPPAEPLECQFCPPRSED